MNSRKILDKYETRSQFPIYNLRISKDSLFLSTCQGELHILTLDLKNNVAISAHQGLVTMMCISNGTLYTVGDDLALRVWKISH